MLRPTGWTRFREWVLVWVCGSMLGALAADAVIGSYDTGLQPIKPSLFTVVAVFTCIMVSLVNKPRLCLATLVIALLPAVRLFDAAVLRRFDSSFQDQITMDLARTMLVLLAIIAVLSTEKWEKTALWAAICAMLLTTGSEIYEMLGFAKFSSIPGRYAGFNSHPNFPPVLLCEMLGIVFALSKNFRFNCLMIAVAVPGVALTYGRSGMIVLALLCGSYILLNARRNFGFLMIVTAIALPLLGIGAAVLESGTQHGVMKDKNTADRLEAIYDLDFEKLKSPERLKDLSDAWEAVQQKPLFGHGTGISGTIYAPHNEYVSLWLELGIPGLVLFAGTWLWLIARSVLTGGRAGYLVFALLAYTPFGQGRIEVPHFSFAMVAAACVLWPKRYQLTLRSLKQAPQTSAAFTPPHPQTLSRQG
ncbi:O-antigen ligase family protein [Prosthecobacter sp.]|uniref:O-antigen ligase family protein n=1 Tax=Prosthecobacter sp. TaxID=1965333 RepID=UPI0037846495